MLNQATAEVILDSISPDGKRLTTLKLRYWRSIHSEFMTHRVFSRNASSSRAIPVSKVVAQVLEDPAGPIHWGQNKPGMQAEFEIANPQEAENLWREAAASAVAMAQKMMDMGLHKQVANRILEPFQFISVLVTSTEWENFFNLRIHEDAQPEIKDLATKIKAAMDASTPSLLPYESWHLPFAHDLDLPLETRLKISTARCARVSYNNFSGDLSKMEEDLALHDRLVISTPPHASPAEHQARPVYPPSEDVSYRSNFDGWVQYRSLVERSVKTRTSLADLVAPRALGTGSAKPEYLPNFN